MPKSGICVTDAPLDCQKAIQEGELRFWAVNGYASGETPGIDQYGSDAILVREYGSRTIPNTSDFGNRRYNDWAWAYAKAYNSCLRRHLLETKTANNSRQKDAGGWQVPNPRQGPGASAL